MNSPCFTGRLGKEIAANVAAIAASRALFPPGLAAKKLQI